MGGVTRRAFLRGGGAREGLAGRLSGRLEGDVYADWYRRASLSPGARSEADFPEIIVQPKSIRDVAAAFRMAGEFSTPVAIWGSGSSQAAKAQAPGALLIDTHRHFNQIESIDCESLCPSIVVQAGASVREVQSALASQNLSLPRSFLWSGRRTLGGCVSLPDARLGVRESIATLAGDLLGLDVVLVDGRLVRLGPFGLRPPRPWDTQVEQASVGQWLSQLLNFGREVSASLRKDWSALTGTLPTPIDVLHVPNDDLGQPLVTGPDGRGLGECPLWTEGVPNLAQLLLGGAGQLAWIGRLRIRIEPFYRHEVPGERPESAVSAWCEKRYSAPHFLALKRIFDPEQRLGRCARVNENPAFVRAKIDFGSHPLTERREPLLTLQTLDLALQQISARNDRCPTQSQLLNHWDGPEGRLTLIDNVIRLGKSDESTPAQRRLHPLSDRELSRFIEPCLACGRCTIEGAPATDMARWQREVRYALKQSRVSLAFGPDLARRALRLMETRSGRLLANLRGRSIKVAAWFERSWGYAAAVGFPEPLVCSERMRKAIDRGLSASQLIWWDECAALLPATVLEDVLRVLESWGIEPGLLVGGIRRNHVLPVKTGVLFWMAGDFARALNICRTRNHFEADPAFPSRTLLVMGEQSASYLREQRPSLSIQTILDFGRGQLGEEQLAEWAERGAWQRLEYLAAPAGLSYACRAFDDVWPRVPHPYTAYLARLG